MGQMFFHQVPRKIKRFQTLVKGGVAHTRVAACHMHMIGKTSPCESDGGIEEIHSNNVQLSQPLQK